MEADGHVEGEVADAVDGVEGERPGGEELEGALGGEGQGAKRRGQRRALEVPADEGRGQVGRREHVQAAAEGGARDALPGGAAEPRLLLVVDLEVRGDGAAEALLGQEGGAVGGGEFLGRYGPVLGEREGC